MADRNLLASDMWNVEFSDVWIFGVGFSRRLCPQKEVDVARDPFAGAKGLQSRGVVEPCLTALKPHRHSIPETGLVRSTSTAYH